MNGRNPIHWDSRISSLLYIAYLERLFCTLQSFRLRRMEESAQRRWTWFVLITKFHSEDELDLYLSPNCTVKMNLDFTYHQIEQWRWTWFVFITKLHSEDELDLYSSPTCTVKKNLDFTYHQIAQWRWTWFVFITKLYSEDEIGLYLSPNYTVKMNQGQRWIWNRTSGKKWQQFLPTCCNELCRTSGNAWENVLTTRDAISQTLYLGSECCN
jgi:hypothetical protein